MMDYPACICGFKPSMMHVEGMETAEWLTCSWYLCPQFGKKLDHVEWLLMDRSRNPTGVVIAQLQQENEALHYALAAREDGPTDDNFPDYIESDEVLD